MAPPPENVLICSARGPHPVKIRPCRPRVSHDANDAALPERSGSTGCDTVGGVSVSRTENMTLAPAKNPLTSTPVSSTQKSSSSPVTPRTHARRRGRCRPNQWATFPNSTRSDRDTMRISAATARVVSRITGQVVGPTDSIPNSWRMSFCQPTCFHTPWTVIHAMSATRTPSTIVRARPRSLGISR